MAHSWLRQLSVVAAALPASALLACVAIAVTYHADDTLATHCRNVNRLPSISAAVGQMHPEKRIWSNCIAVSCAMRLLVALCYHQEISARLRRRVKPAATVHLGLSCAELFSLLGLSVVASSDNYAVHRNCFVTFLLSSFVYMLLHVRIAALLIRSRSIGCDRALFTTRSFIAKLLLLGAYCGAILLAAYFYARHQAHCEDMMYSYFAASEYAVVYVNILFHFTAYFDLGHVPIRLIIRRTLRHSDDQSAMPLVRRSPSPLAADGVSFHSAVAHSFLAADLTP